MERTLEWGNVWNGKYFGFDRVGEIAKVAEKSIFVRAEYKQAGEFKINNNNEKNMSNEKFYKVKKDNLLWKKGAILQNFCSGYDGLLAYGPINELWNQQENQIERLSARFIEGDIENFERVYKIEQKGEEYKTKKEALESLNKQYKA